VVPTVSGNIYVLSGKDGSKVQPFPYRAHGRIMSPVLLLDMSKRGEKPQGLTLATTSFDGYLYLIEGSSGCADVVDIGETSYVIFSLFCRYTVSLLGIVLTIQKNELTSLHIDRYTMVLADNVDGGDDLDLIVTTMNGNVFCFSTQSPHHPLKVCNVYSCFLFVRWYFNSIQISFCVNTLQLKLGLYIMVSEITRTLFSF
jgi:hypothetical protein